jgi:hypothetical protein
MFKLECAFKIDQRMKRYCNRTYKRKQPNNSFSCLCEHNGKIVNVVQKMKNKKYKVSNGFTGRSEFRLDSHKTNGYLCSRHRDSLVEQIADNTKIILFIETD